VPIYGVTSHLKKTLNDSSVSPSTTVEPSRITSRGVVPADVP
jgi:hypothetical protein